jgi:hypothetical protein
VCVEWNMERKKDKQGDAVLWKEMLSETARGTLTSAGRLAGHERPAPLPTYEAVSILEAKNGSISAY